MHISDETSTNRATLCGRSNSGHYVFQNRPPGPEIGDYRKGGESWRRRLSKFKPMKAAAR
jgi:hypothetical protein